MRKKDDTFLRITNREIYEEIKKVQSKMNEIKNCSIHNEDRIQRIENWGKGVLGLGSSILTGIILFLITIPK